MSRNPIERALGVWSTANYRDVILPGLGAVTCGQFCDAMATEALSRTGAVKVKALEWEETHSRRSDEDPTTEWNGGFEADSALGYYEISMGIGSDAYYWAVTNPLGDNVGSDFEDPSYAKAAAQQDYERRILAALEPAARDANTVASHETTNVEDKPAAPWPVSYANSTAPGRPFEPAATEGQQPVAWGVFYRGKIVAVSLHKSYHYTVPLYTRPSEQAVTEEMVVVAAKAVVAEWQKMVAETSPHMSPGDHARAFVSPGNYRLIRAAIKAAMEAGR